MKVYGCEICIDCKNFKYINEKRNLNIKFIDITENTENMKEFLNLRDKRKEFDIIRENGKIGIPAFLSSNNKITFDINEAFSWIGEKEVAEDEIIYK